MNFQKIGYIAKSTLTRAMGSSTPHTGNPGNSTACTPGLSRGLMTSHFVHSIRLSLVLGHISVDKADHIRPNGSLEDSRKGGLSCIFSCLIIDCY